MNELGCEVAVGVLSVGRKPPWFSLSFSSGRTSKSPAAAAAVLAPTFTVPVNCGCQFLLLRDAKMGVPEKIISRVTLIRK